MSETSKTGVWIDTKTDEVVESEPEEGVQLVAPGGPVTPAVAKRIEAERAARSGGPKAAARPEDKQAPAPANKAR